MPRDKGGIGRTGRKHKKKSKFDAHRQPKAELAGESSSPGQEAASSNKEELEEAAVVEELREEACAIMASYSEISQLRAGDDQATLIAKEDEAAARMEALAKRASEQVMASSVPCRPMSQDLSSRWNS